MGDGTESTIPHTAEDRLLMESRFDPAAVRQLRAMGPPVHELDAWDGVTGRGDGAVHRPGNGSAAWSGGSAVRRVRGGVLRLTRTHFPQTVIASAARQSRRGNERRSWNEIAIRQRRTSLLAMTNWVRGSHLGSLSEAGFTGLTGCTGLGATLPSDDLNPDNPSNPGNPASDIPPRKVGGYA